MQHDKCPPDSQSRAPIVRGTNTLLLVGVVSVTLWGIVLPWLGQQPAIADHIANLRGQNIDPSARYYSDLETLPPVVHHLEKLHTTHHAKLWGR